MRRLGLFVMLAIFFNVSACSAQNDKAAAKEEPKEEGIVIEAKPVGASASASKESAPSSSETAQSSNPAAAPAQAVQEEPNFIIRDGKVIPNPAKNPGSAAGPSSSLVQGGTEANFIVVDGRVVPNPNKGGGAVPAAAGPGQSSGDEPNFITVNGQVVPNPNKRGAQ